MRTFVLLGGLIGGIASVAVLLSAASVPSDPSGTGLAPPVAAPHPLSYVTGLLMLVGGVAIFWLPMLATVALGLAAALGMSLGLMGSNQDQLAFGILALVLTGAAIAVVVREGRSQEATGQAEGS